MNKKKISNEVMTGIMVLACAGLLVFFLYKTGKIGVKPETYRIQAVFSSASGIEKNSPVMLAGVEVGEVKDIQLRYGDDTKVAISLSLDKKAKIRTDSVASINTLGLMGEKYIEISAGSHGKPFLEAGSTITGEEPFQFEKLAKKGEQIADTLNDTLLDIKRFVNNLDDTVVNNREGIDNIIADLEATANNFKEFSDDIKRNPWKLLIKGKEKTKEDEEKKESPSKKKKR